MRFELTLILFPPSNNVCFLGQAKRLALTVSCTFPTVLQVVHEFMCEKEPYKRRFLEVAFPDEDCCIFKDATELYTDKRACVLAMTKEEAVNVTLGFSSSFDY